LNYKQNDSDEYNEKNLIIENIKIILKKKIMK